MMINIYEDEDEEKENNKKDLNSLIKKFQKRIRRIYSYSKLKYIPNDQDFSLVFLDFLSLQKNVEKMWKLFQIQEEISKKMCQILSEKKNQIQ